MTNVQTRTVSGYGGYVAYSTGVPNINNYLSVGVYYDPTTNTFTGTPPGSSYGNYYAFLTGNIDGSAPTFEQTSITDPQTLSDAQLDAAYSQIELAVQNGFTIGIQSGGTVYDLTGQIGNGDPQALTSSQAQTAVMALAGAQTVLDQAAATPSDQGGVETVVITAQGATDTIQVSDTYTGAPLITNPLTPTYSNGSSPIPVDPSKFNIDYSWLEANENGVDSNGNPIPEKLTATVPTSNSGVTIATGVDLSKFTAQQLAVGGVDQSIIDALSPYLATGPGDFGPKGSAASAALAANGGLTITSTTASELDQFAINYIATTVATNYNSANPGQNDFTSLPQSVQTALIDVGYHYGPNGSPQLSYEANNGLWIEAISNLNSFGDSLPSAVRRNGNDANLLQGAFNAGQIIESNLGGT